MGSGEMLAFSAYFLYLCLLYYFAIRFNIKEEFRFQYKCNGEWIYEYSDFYWQYCVGFSLIGAFFCVIFRVIIGYWYPLPSYC